MAITTHMFTAATFLSIAAAASAGISVAALAAPAVAATATQTREVCASSVRHCARGDRLATTSRERRAGMPARL